jgi:hypothetical protein
MATAKALRWRRGVRITSWGCEYLADVGEGWHYRVFPHGANWRVELERMVDHRPVATKIVGAPQWRLDRAKASAQRHYEARGGRP